MSEILNNQVETIASSSLKIAASNVPIGNYDEVVIKHISYIGSVYEDVVYLLWSNYTNSYVASFTVDLNSFSTDQSYETVIKLNRSNMGFDFKLDMLDLGGIAPTTDTAFIAITLQFNKYKK